MFLRKSFFMNNAMEEYMKKIAENTSIRQTYQVVLTGKDSRLEAKFIPPLIGGCKYEIALVSLETYYSFPNVDEKNNKIRVFTKKWVEIIIPVGCYELKAINKELQRQVVQKGGTKDDVTLSPNLNTFKCEMTLGDGIKVDMTGPDSLRTILGFDKKMYTEKFNISEHTVNIVRVNSILVYCSLIGSSYLNSTQQPISYSFYPDVEPGEKIVMRPTTLIYLPVALDIIPQMTAWLTDQDNNPLDLRGEKLTLKFHIRAC